jgi:hypothetical protein
MQARSAVAVLGLLAGLLAGCEGVTTGTEIARIALQPAAGGERGAYAPVKFNLSPEMNPVAFNLRADFTQEATEFGRWNSYRAVLTQNGATIATRNININHPQTDAQGNAPPPAGTVHTLFYVDVQSSGEYELTITPSKPVEITLKEASADARRNVQRPPQ